jgi:spermidine synthase
MRSLVLTLFLLSGACGLIYQVVWSRILTQVFGSTALAVGTVLAAFMSGLALGSYGLGRTADGARNPLRLYAWYEIGVGLSCLASLLLLDRTAALYVRLHAALGASEILVAGARFLIAFLLVLLPTVLMGATLPVLARFVITRTSTVGSSLSSLYAVNTAGAVGGALLAGFVLIARLGIHRSIHLAVAGNVGIGLVALAASRRAGGPAPPAGAAAERPAGADPAAGPGRAGYRLLLWGFGLSGFASFAYEVLWTRALAHLLGSSTYAFTTMLTAFLSGIALGGYLARFLAGRGTDGFRWFGWLQVGIGASAAAALPVLFAAVESPAWKEFLRRTAGGAGMLLLSRFGAALAILLVPATMIGATFPLVGSIFVRDLRLTGAEVGRVYAVNTAGNVLGALAPGLLLLPVLGIQKGVILMACLNASVGAWVLLARSRRPAWLRLAAPAALAAAAALLPGAPIRFQFPSEHQTPAHRVLYYREGVSGTTKVFEDRDTGGKQMSIDGIVIGGTEFTDYKQQVLAHLPKLLLPQARSELSIGLGSGVLIGESLRHPGLERAVCVEIEPAVVEAAAHFAAENHGVLDDPRARIVVDDVANFLRTTPERYDIISADEKTADNYASNAFSYSRDYYALLREHLTGRGLVIQWVPNQLPSSQYRMVLRTFAASFPEVSLFYFPPAGKGGPVNTFLVGSIRPLAIDPAAMNEALEAARFEGWRPYGIDSAEAVLAHYVAGGGPIREATAAALENSLEHPRYEFYSPREYAVPSNRRVLGNHEFLLALRRAHGPAEIAARLPDGGRLREAAGAEEVFLDGLRLQLEGTPHREVAARLARAVDRAPWNRNLRSQALSYLWSAAGVRYLAGEYREALQIMGQAVEDCPEVGEVRYYHGLALLRTGAAEAGLEEMRRAIALDARLLPPRRALVSSLLDSAAIDEAAEQLAAILAIDPEDLFALVRYATLLAEQRGEHEEARAWLARAARLSPEDPSVIDAGAWLAYLRGDREAARRIVAAGGRYYEGTPLYERRRSRILQPGP